MAGRGLESIYRGVMPQSKDWYGSLYSDLWEDLLYGDIVTHIENQIAIASTPAQFQMLIGILFAILRLQTILSRGKELEELEKGICNLAALLAAGGLHLSAQQKSKIMEILIKNAVPPQVVENISDRI